MHIKLHFALEMCWLIWCFVHKQATMYIYCRSRSAFEKSPVMYEVGSEGITHFRYHFQ